MCEGSSIDTGTCSEFECGEISPETFALIRWELRSHYYSIYAQEGDSVTIERPTELIEKIIHQSPTAEIRWTHEGNTLNFLNTTFKYVASGSVITIADLTKKDSGVYLCMVHSHNNMKTPIRVVVLTVESRNIDKIVFERTSLSLLCKTAPLQLIYMDLITKWFLNGSLYVDYNFDLVDDRNFLKINHVHFNHSGVWSCAVEQVDLGFIWNTTVYRIQVKPSPKFLNYLMDDKLTRYIFGHLKSTKTVLVVIILFVAFVIIMAVFGTFCYLLVSKRRSAPRESNKSRTRKLAMNSRERRHNVREENASLIENEEERLN